MRDGEPRADVITRKLCLRCMERHEKASTQMPKIRHPSVTQATPKATAIDQRAREYGGYRRAGRTTQTTG